MATRSSRNWHVLICKPGSGSDSNGGVVNEIYRPGSLDDGASRPPFQRRTQFLAARPSSDRAIRSAVPSECAFIPGLLVA